MNSKKIIMIAAASFIAGIFISAAVIEKMPAANAQGRSRWEYRWEKIPQNFSGLDMDAAILKMNQLGAEGWELSILAGNMQVFKRAK